MRTISKKIDPIWYEQIVTGRKKFELRLADFEIEDGDIIRLEEYTTGENRKPTGRFIEKKVNYVRKVGLNDWIKKQPELIEKGFYIIQFD